jgi:hypothetical protein
LIERKFSLSIPVLLGFTSPLKLFDHHPYLHGYLPVFLSLFEQEAIQTYFQLCFFPSFNSRMGTGEGSGHWMKKKNACMNHSKYER